MNADLASFMLRARVLGGEVTPVLRAIEGIDRRSFVRPEHADFVYRNETLPLPCGQATDRIDDLVRLLASADLAPHHRVLEIGTGGGFMTAILSRLVGSVVTLERYRTLIDASKAAHARAGVRNVTYLQADGGNPDAIEGTFDRIVSSVAFPDAPKGFIGRLSPDGVMVAPIGERCGEQYVVRLEKVGLRFERRVVGKGWFPPIERGAATAL